MREMLMEAKQNRGVRYTLNQSIEFLRAVYPFPNLFQDYHVLLSFFLSIDDCPFQKLLTFRYALILVFQFSRIDSTLAEIPQGPESDELFPLFEKGSINMEERIEKSMQQQKQKFGVDQGTVWDSSKIVLKYIKRNRLNRVTTGSV